MLEPMRRLFMKLTLGFLTTLLISSCTPKVYQPLAIKSIDLPRDDANHLAPIEWWYYTGHFYDNDNNRYGFELTFFKTYLPRSLKLFGAIPAYFLIEKIHVGHFAITDFNNESFELAQKADFWAYPSYSSSTGLNVGISNWYAKRAADGESHEIFATLGDKAIHFILSPEKPVAAHGNPPGIQSMGKAGVSYYISYTRMNLRGDLLTNCVLTICEKTAVMGQAWHDHQWGNFSLEKFAGWDWFSMQFENGTELMLYLIRQPDGSFSDIAGSFIDKDGKLVTIKKEDVELSIKKVWQSEKTGAIYPLGWNLKIDRLNINVDIEAALDQQEMDTRASTGIVYWEGAVDISGNRSGVGYVELTNYDLYPYGKTDADTKLKANRLLKDFH